MDQHAEKQILEIDIFKSHLWTIMWHCQTSICILKLINMWRIEGALFSSFGIGKGPEQARIDSAA